MTTQVALLTEEGKSVLGTDSAPFPVPLDVEVLGEDKIKLRAGGPLPTGVDFDPITGGLSLPVGYYQITYTIVTEGASFKPTAISFEASKDTYIGLMRTSTTAAAILTQNGLVLGSKEQLHDYTLLCVGPTGVDEPHDPVILFEPPG